MTLIPDEINTIVFNKGTWNGLNTLIPKGGQIEPTSILGERLLWKKAQKNLTKKKISDTINKAIPQRNPNSTIEVWSPWIVPSRLISRHHWIITNINIITPKINKIIEFKWNQETIPVVKYNPPTAPNKGHGDSSTIWYGWHIIFDIYFRIFLLKLTLINSFKYNELKIVNTYDWIQATATSNINNKINLTIRIIITNIDTFTPWDPNNVNNKWPATILAANRIDNVIGRIIFLTVSIITIIGIKNEGVPKGTRWANSLLYWNTIENNIVPIQIGKAKTKVIDKCLVLVKIYGINPIKFEKIIKKNTEIKIKIVPGIIISPKTASNSFFKNKTIFKKDLDNWEFINQYIWGKKKIQINTENQFNIIFIEKILILGSKDENKFIILLEIGNCY